MRHKFDATLLKNDESSLMWYWIFMVPPEIVDALLKQDRRVICGINGTENFHCALTSDGNGGNYIILNKERRKKMKVEVGDTLQVEVESDTSEYGMQVTEAFTELCFQDPEGNKIFHSLTKGKQRTLLHLMSKPKSEQKQLEKVLIIFDYLKSVNGALDFKELNAAFKNNRFKI